jgi:hypothetical protein
MGLQRKLSCRAPCPGATAEVIVYPGHLDLSALNDRMCDIGQSKPGRLAYVGKASRLTSFVVWGLKRFYLATADRRLGMTGGIRAFLRDAGWCHTEPGDKSPGYYHMSLRDEEPSQTALILVPFNPGLSPVAPSATGRLFGSHIGPKHQHYTTTLLRRAPRSMPMIVVITSSF